MNDHQTVTITARGRKIEVPAGESGAAIKEAVRAAAGKVSREDAGSAKPASDDPAMFSSKETGEDRVRGISRDRLRSIVERIERLEEEKKAAADDIKDVYAEAKANGFDTKALRRIVAIRKQDQNERLEQEAIVDTYMAALGMLPASDGD
jgi:uncharacterized protein (UPF0335 family)